MQAEAQGKITGMIKRMANDMNTHLFRIRYSYRYAALRNILKTALFLLMAAFLTVWIWDSVRTHELAAQMTYKIAELEKHQFEVHDLLDSILKDEQTRKILCAR